jgi:hypothetical protein
MALLGIWRNLGLRLHETCAIARRVRRCGLRRGSPATASSLGGSSERAKVSPVRGRTFSLRRLDSAKVCRASLAERASLVDPCTRWRVVGGAHNRRATPAKRGGTGASSHAAGRFPPLRVLEIVRLFSFARRTMAGRMFSIGARPPGRLVAAPSSVGTTRPTPAHIGVSRIFQPLTSSGPVWQPEVRAATLARAPTSALRARRAS